MHFTLRDILANPLGYQDIVQEEVYNYKSLTPTHSWNGTEVPNPPIDITLTEEEDGLSIAIDTQNTNARKYVIYRFEKDVELNYTNPKNIVTVLYNQEDTLSFLDTEINLADEYTYGVTSISPTGIESETATEAKWQIEDEVNKEKLAATIVKAEDTNESEYTPESWRVLIKALANARKIFEDDQATQSDVDQVLADLEESLSELVLADDPVDTSELEALVSSVSKLEKFDYTSESWDVLINVMKRARAVLANEGATSDEVNEILTQLTVAVDQLKEKPTEVIDKVKLQELVNEIENMSKTDYTEQSWRNLTKKTTDAKMILTNDDATQEEVDAMVSKLNQAVNNLVKMTTPKDKGKSINKVVDVDKNKGGALLPKTATNNYNFLLVGSIIFMIGILVYFIGRRKTGIKLNENKS